MNQDKQSKLAKVANALTDEATTIKIKILYPTRWQKALMFLRLQKPYKTFEVKPASVGKFIQISRLLLGIDVTEFNTKDYLNSIYKLADREGEKLIEAVAIAIHPGKKAPNRLLDFLQTNVNNRDLTTLTSTVLELSDAGGFFLSIINLKKLSILEMNEIQESAPSTEQSAAS